MDRNELIEIARAHMKTRITNRFREPGYLFDHSLRVATITEKLNEMETEEKVFPVATYAGALFHDIGKGFDRHNAIGGAVARELLAHLFSDEDLDDICRIVVGHPVRKADETEDFYPLALVQDADIIDHHGTQEVWLKFLRSAGQGERQQSLLDFFEKENKQGMYEEKRRLLNLESSKKVYDERIAFVRGFMDRFAVESEGRIVGEF